MYKMLIRKSVFSVGLRFQDTQFLAQPPPKYSDKIPQVDNVVIKHRLKGILGHKNVQKNTMLHK